MYWHDIAPQHLWSVQAINNTSIAEHRENKVMAEIKSVCEIIINDTNLKTGSFCRTCRYHKKQAQLFKSDQLFPAEFCPHAYRTIYPYALALLYNAKYLKPDGTYSRDITIRCPGSTDYIKINLSIEYLYPKILRTLKDAAIWFLHKLKIPAEYPDKNVMLDICNVKGNCRYNIKAGSRFKFNLFNREELCPASLYGLYPILISDKGTKNLSVQAHCPDPQGVFYNIENRSFSCTDFLEEIKIMSGKENYDCSNGLNEEHRYDEKICPLAFYAAFPYYWTYIHSGKFDWVRKNERVQVQCPKMNGIVMEIELIRHGGSGDGAVEAKIIKVDHDCAYGYKKGDRFVLDSRNQQTCYELLINMIAVTGSDTRNIFLPCPRTHKQLVRQNHSELR